MLTNMGAKNEMSTLMMITIWQMSAREYTKQNGMKA